MDIHTQNEHGLTADEARARLLEYGRNELTPQKKASSFKKILKIVCEPMFLLLLFAAVIYFILGEPRDGAIMLIFVVGVTGIDVVQELKTDRTLNALRDLSSPRATVIRDGAEQSIPGTELVPGDRMLLREGEKIPADGMIVKCSDLCVDESSLTGEAAGVWKTVSDGTPSEERFRRDACYAGTLVTQGSAAVVIEKTGAETEFGKIGVNVAAAPDCPSPLKKQTARLVRQSAVIAAALFLLVGVFTYFNISDHAPRARLIESILSGVTLSMAMIPEEFPVILAVFLSMGAWRLARKQSLLRHLSSVETLGAISVLCVDKTGTITKNQMTVQHLVPLSGDETALCRTMGLACEADAYDPMEKAMLVECEKHGISKSQLFSFELLREYPFTNEQKMMGHVFRGTDGVTIAAKGSPERIFTLCEPGTSVLREAQEALQKMGADGLRVIAVAGCTLSPDVPVPEALTDCRLTLLGLVGLSDPPRESISADIALCSRAGVRVVMITGDNGLTAASIAKKVGIPHSDEIITGDMLDEMDDGALGAAIKTVSIFSRVAPEHKMRIVRAFQTNGDIVAMTGDGVNDAPALKHADIGIAMGKRGSEVSREAADLILLDDNFTTIVETVRDGRRIYDNIRKAVGYVFTIHIPIAVAALLAPLLGIKPDALLLLPLHVVLLELIIDPTCSLVLERQPAEANLMDRPPRDPQAKLLDARLLGKSVLQGAVLFAASFFAYYATLQSGAGAETARSMGLTVIILANLLLVHENCSAHDSIFRSLRLFARDTVMWASALATVVMLSVILYTPLASVLKLAPLSFPRLLFSVLLACVSVLWYELVKLVIRHRAQRGNDALK